LLLLLLAVADKTHVAAAVPVRLCRCKMLACLALENGVLSAGDVLPEHLTYLQVCLCVYSWSCSLLQNLRGPTRIIVCVVAAGGAD
jgi:hypothetical protein